VAEAVCSVVVDIVRLHSTVLVLSRYSGNKGDIISLGVAWTTTCSTNVPVGNEQQICGMLKMEELTALCLPWWKRGDVDGVVVAFWRGLNGRRGWLSRCHVQNLEDGY